MLLGEGNVRLGSSRLQEVIQADQLTNQEPVLKAIRYAFDLGLLFTKSLHSKVNSERLGVRTQKKLTCHGVEILLRTPRRVRGSKKLKELRPISDDDHSLYLLGKYLYEEKQYEEALMKLEQALGVRGHTTSEFVGESPSGGGPEKV